MRINPDLTNKRFGRWLVLSRSEIRKYGSHISYDCRCDCGTERLVSGTLLKNGHSQSCGCAFIEAAAKSQITHGLTGHRLAGTWRSMKERCYNKNHVAYARYGGRGITVCKRWHDMANFIADNEASAAKGLTLDRKDNNLGYSPENCRWTTVREQMRNRESTVWIEFHGRKQTLTDWASELGIVPSALTHRLQNWSLEQALTHPVIEPQNRRASI